MTPEKAALELRRLRATSAFKKTVQYSILAALESLTPDQIDVVLTELSDQLAVLKARLKR